MGFQDIYHVYAGNFLERETVLSNYDEYLNYHAGLRSAGRGTRYLYSVKRNGVLHVYLREVIEI